MDNCFRLNEAKLPCGLALYALGNSSGQLPLFPLEQCPEGVRSMPELLYLRR